jgi:drug/metabolite transporter (DMT)-like permease
LNFEGGLLGLGAAAAWGIADMCATMASRRVGSVRTTAFVVPVSATILISLFLLSGAVLPPDPRVLLGSVVVGAFGSALYFIGYAAFRAGPISVVSPIFSAAGGLTVILAIVVLGERPSPLNLVAAGVATIGVILAAVVRTEGRTRPSLAGPGVRYALVVLVIGGILPIITSIVVRDAGWLPALTTARIANMAFVALTLVAIGQFRRRRDRRGADPASAVFVEPGLVPIAVEQPAASAPDLTSVPIRELGRPTLGLLVAVGAIEAFALACFYAGLEIGPTWLVGLASSFGPLIVVSGGVLFLGERPRRAQWAGVTMILASVIVLAVR